MIGWLLFLSTYILAGILTQTVAKMYFSGEDNEVFIIFSYIPLLNIIPAACFIGWILIFNVHTIINYFSNKLTFFLSNLYKI